MGEIERILWFTVAVETVRATVEGTFVKGLDKPARRKVLTFALDRLISADG